MEQRAASTLVAGPAWVGDMVMAQSLFLLLKERNPEEIIDVLAPTWSLPLLQRMPEVRCGIEVPVAHGEFGLWRRLRLGRSLRAQHYDRAIVLPRSLKSALVPFFAKARRRVGYRGEMRFGLLNDMRPLDKSALTMTVQRYLALGMGADEQLPPQNIPIPRLRIDADNQTSLLRRLGLSLERPVVALLPGAEYGPAKQWPAERYGELARGLSQRGYQVWLIGSAKDARIGATILDGNDGNAVNLCGKTALVDAVDLIALCAAVVSNDSGLMHVAAAVDVPLVAVYGSSSPAYTPPLSRNVEILYRGLECSPCFKRTCPMGHTHCLTKIDAGDALAAVGRLLHDANLEEREEK